MLSLSRRAVTLLNEGKQAKRSARVRMCISLSPALQFLSAAIKKVLLVNSVSVCRAGVARLSERILEKRLKMGKLMGNGESNCS